MSTDDLPPFLDDEEPVPPPQRPQLRAVNGSKPSGNGKPKPKPQQVQPTQEFLVWRSRSYATAVSVIETNGTEPGRSAAACKDILEGRVLEWDEMAGVATLNRKPVEEVDISRIRFLIERRCPGGVDKNQNAKPLMLNKSDIGDAVMQVAKSRRFHPVRNYLNALAWDGVPRIDLLPDLISAARSQLNIALLRRWMISAVARARSPGCKVDTMLILVGDQGTMKSTFFKTLASEPWFCDTPIDIRSKDSYITLRTSWICEWAELESIARARDAEAVKAFLTSSVDTYRPPYERFEVQVPRSCVIVGSSNRREFLADDTGNRRMWPVVVTGLIDLVAIAQWRDQLWAEAAAAHASGEPWWLTSEEEALLQNQHVIHATQDAWEELVLRWLDRFNTVAERNKRTSDPALRADDVDRITTAKIIAGALSKPAGQWVPADERRVIAIMKRLGWKLDPNKPRGMSREWLAPSVQHSEAAGTSPAN